MLHEDFVLKQTELLGRFLRTILYPGESDPHPSFAQEAVELQNKLITDLQNHDYNGAENRLFEALEKNKSDDLFRLALWFYDRLASLPEQELEDHDFSHEEVLEGMQEIENMLVHP